MVGNHRQHAVWVSNLIVRACIWLLVVSSTPVAAQSVAPAVLDQATEATEIEATESETADAETTGDVPLLPSSAIEEEAPIEDIMVAETEANPNATPAPRPAVPTLLLPDDGEVTTAVNHPPVGIPMLSWERQLFAVHYVVQVSPSDSFAEAKSIKTYATAYVPFLDMPDGPYYWRVQACGAGTNNCSEFSEVRSFRRDWSDDGEIVPTLISPPNNAVRSAFQPEDFSWTPVPGADGYLFEVATDPNFASIKYKVITIKAHHTPDKRFENSTYYWRVTPAEATLSHTQNIYSKPSATGTFVFGWEMAPRLLSPDADVDLKFVPRFQWTAVEAAKSYILEVSTQPDMNPNSLKLVVPTTHTDYTPIKNLGNDQDYYWRVKAQDNRGVFSPYSEIRRFRVKWNFVVQSLPSRDANNPLTKQSYPYLSWTPIPGAERYQVQFDESDYKLPVLDAEFYNVNDASIYKIKDSTIYLERTYNWRVRGIDAQGNYTPWSSDIYGDFPFRWEYETSPSPIYPPYYFTPDVVNLPQHRDVSIAWPVFVWDNALTCFTKNCLTIRPDYYELNVASDITFQDIRFRIKTKGNAAAPTTNNPFTDLTDESLYYWRVRAYLEKGAVDEQMGVDFVWTTRIDRKLPVVEKSDVISLLHPYEGFESVGIPPVLGWQPMNEAESYRVQISKNPDFEAAGAIVDEAIAQFLNYVPWQNRVDDMPYGTYWWRVQALNGAELPISDWSEVRHFNLSIDVATGNKYDLVPPEFPSSIFSSNVVTISEPITDPTTGETSTYIAESIYDPSYTFVVDSPDDQSSPYNIDKLHMLTNRENLVGIDFSSQDWIITFKAPTLNAATSVLYVIYVDIDHVAGSGGTSDPKGKPIAIDELYQPEFVLYITRTSTGINASEIAYYSWNAEQLLWLPGPGLTTSLADIGGRAWYASDTNAVQLLVPYEKLGLNDIRSSGSLAVSIYSMHPSSGGIIDSIPAQEDGVVKPVFVSDMLMPLYPFDTPLSNPTVHYDMPSFRWRMPYFDSVDGYQVQISRDAKFSDIVETWEQLEARVYSEFSWLPTAFQSTNAYADNESYYMRVRLRHERFKRLTDFDYGPWSSPIRIKLDSRKVRNLSISTGNPAGTTPTFFWERVDGASGYTIQVDNDANFTTPEVNQPVDGTSFTPDQPMPDGLYHWRVAMRRNKTILGSWSAVQTFTKQTIAPTLISPINDVEISDQPTFKWTPVLAPSAEPRIAAGVYQLQIGNDPQFSKPFVYQTEGTSYTPKVSENLKDGTWYWRVAVVDSKKRVGTYSEAQQFTRNYPKPQLLAPLQGAAVGNNGVFQWTDIPAAATYEIQIDDDPAFNSPVKGNTNGTTYVPTAQMKPGLHHWRVRMIDGDQIEGGYETGFVTIVDANSTGKVFLPIIRN